MLYLSAQYSVGNRRDITEIYNAIGLAIIVPFIGAYLLYRADPRYLIGIALILLVGAAAEDAAGNAIAANDIAIVSYYCLVAGVILMIWDGYLARHRDGRTARWIRSALPALRDRILAHGDWLSYMSSLLPVAVFSVISLVILQSFLSPGYVLVTDMVFGPIVPTSGLFGLHPFLGGGVALTAFEALLSVILPGWAIQKIFLFLIFFLSGLTMYIFAGREMGPARFYAAFLYMVNPFTYARMLAGAWSLDFAYALSPLVLLAFIRLTAYREGRIGTYRDSFFAAALFTLLAVFDIHTLVLVLFLAVLFYLVSIAYRGHEVSQFLRRTAVPIALFGAMFVLFNAYWLAVSSSSSGSILGGFTFLDAIAFASQPTVLHNTMLSVAAMYGFFRSGYQYPVNFYPLLLSIFVLFLFLALFGFMANWRTRTTGPLAVTMLTGLVIAIILATGISSPLTAGLYTYLFNHLPFFNGFREPQKFVAVVVMAYSYLGALGLLEFETYLRGNGISPPLKKGRRFAEVLVVMLIMFSLVSPFVYSYMEINGFNGQLTNSQYPTSWYRAESIMAQNSTDYSVLVLPWHTYMYYNWSGTRFASPFDQFFKQTLIVGGSNSYVGGEGTARSGADLLILQMLDQRNNITHLGNILSLLDAKYLFLSKSADYANYTFLYRQQDLSLVFNSSECALFLNDHTVARSFIVQSVRSVPSYSQLINLSASVDLMDYAWVVGGAVGAVPNSTYVPLSSQKVDDASYSVALPGLIGLNASSYVVFIPPAGNIQSWTGESSMLSYYSTQNLSGVGDSLQLYTIYSVKGGPATVTFTFAPYRTLQYGYAVSAVSFSVTAALLAVTAYPAVLERLRKGLTRLTGR